MHLKDIEIKNFKSIRHQKIEGCKRINLFIGPPNVGKSNILEALSFLGLLQEESQSPTLRQLVRVEEFFELFSDGNIQEEIEIKYFETRLFKINYYTQKELRAKNIISKYDMYLTNKGKLELFGFNSFNMSNESFDKSVTFEDDTRSKIFKNPKILEENEFDPYFSLKSRDVFKVRKYEYAKSVKQDKTNFERALSYPYGENLYFIVSSNEELRKELVDILSGYGLKLFFEKGDRYQMKAMKVLTDDTVFTIPFHQIADTIQRLIFYKAAIRTNNETSLLFEEPESHMFPPYIKLFTNDIIENKTNQFFINTHSPFVLNEFLENSRDELSVYVVGYNEGETKIKRLSDEELKDVYDSGVDLFFNIESYI